MEFMFSSTSSQVKSLCTILIIGVSSSGFLSFSFITVACFRPLVATQPADASTVPLAHNALPLHFRIPDPSRKDYLLGRLGGMGLEVQLGG
jgi:hypothetical protein